MGMPAGEAWSVVVGDRHGAPLVRAAALGDELLVEIAAPPDTYFAAAALRALLAARHGSLAYPEQEPARIGAASTVAGTVVDAAMASVVGASVDLRYANEGWVVIGGVAATVDVYVRGDAPTLVSEGAGDLMTNVPLVVGFDAGAGRVIYTSFHDDDENTAQQQQLLDRLMFEL